MGVSKESISKFLIGNRFHVKLRILSPYSNRNLVNKHYQPTAPPLKFQNKFRTSCFNNLRIGWTRTPLGIDKHNKNKNLALLKMSFHPPNLNLATGLCFTKVTVEASQIGDLYIWHGDTYNIWSLLSRLLYLVRSKCLSPLNISRKIRFQFGRHTVDCSHESRHINSIVCTCFGSAGKCVFFRIYESWDYAFVVFPW